MVKGVKSPRGDRARCIRGRGPKREGALLNRESDKQGGLLACPNRQHEKVGPQLALTLSWSASDCAIRAPSPLTHASTNPFAGSPLPWVLALSPAYHAVEGDLIVLYGGGAGREMRRSTSTS